MKQIKAFVHRNRVSDLIHALEAGGFKRLSLFDVKGLLRALSAREQQYSVEFGDQVISEVQMEWRCSRWLLIVSICEPAYLHGFVTARRFRAAGDRDART
ncbi:hypothetical protein [Thermomonas fusca]|uniref:hypothetical protein n=1 Tax=Thermomonas fusca TaxID=215690 RepID=UPI0003F7F19F|nr:hypothetical protein [Thermomonas fusca]